MSIMLGEAASLSQRHEIVIGTSDNRECGGDHEAPQHPSGPEPPSIAQAAECIAGLREYLLKGSTPILTGESVSALPPRYASVTIAACDLERIARICDLLNQILYWAIEEGSSFVLLPSQLSEVQAPEAVFACLLSGRPKLVASGLQITHELMKHTQSASEVVRVAKLYEPYVVRGNEPTVGECHDSGGPAALVRILCVLLQSFPGVVGVVAEATAVAAQVAVVCGVEVVLQSPLIAEILGALQRHRDSPVVQVRATFFFSVMVDLPRNAAPCPGTGGSDAAVRAAPVAVLFCHVGVVCSFMVDAANAHWQNMSVKMAVLHYLNVCARHGETRCVLLQRGAYTIAMRALTGLYQSFEVFAEAAEIVGHLIPLLDVYQRRSLVFVLRKLLVVRAEVEVLHVILALICSMLVSPERGPQSNEGGPSLGLFAHYTMDGLPAGHHVSTPISVPSAACVGSRRLGKGSLAISPPLQAVEYEDTKQLMLQICLPQLMMHISDYYSELYEEDGDGATLKLRDLARQCVAKFALSRH